MRRYGVVALVLSAMMSGFATQAVARNDDLLDLSLSDLANVQINSASRYDQDISRAPAIVSVVTRQDIERYGANNLSEVLAYFPGFLPLSDPTTGRSGLSLRGDGSLTSERILTLIDGKPYRSVASEGFVVSELYQTFPLSAVERIELIRGPGSAMYGGTAVTGIVNIVTREVDESGGELTAQTGNRDSNQESFFVGARPSAGANVEKNDWQVSLAGNKARTDGWSVEGTNGAAPFKYSYPSDGESVLFNAANGNFYFKTLWMNMTYNYPQPTRLDVYDQLQSRQNYYDMGYSGDINAKLRYDMHYSRLEIDDGNLSIGDVEDLAEGNLFFTLSEATRLQAGASINKSRTYSTNSLVTGVDEHPHMRGGLYAQIDHDWNKHWSSFAGAQWNKESGGDGRVSPRMGVIYHYNEVEGVKLLYNEAFRAPTAVEANMNITLTGLGTAFVENPQLNSETVKTIDLQWFHYGKKAEYTVTAFHSQYNDRIQNQDVVIAYVPFPVIVTPGQFVQNHDLTSYGLEWEGKFHLTPHDRVDSNWVWQQNEYSGGNESETLMPTWTATLGYTHTFSSDVEWSILNQHLSAFSNTQNSPSAPNHDSESYNLLSSQIMIPVEMGVVSEKPLKLFVKGSNLLDETVWQPALATNNVNTTPSESGRTWSVGVRWQW